MEGRRVRLLVDFQNADSLGRVRLNMIGTLESLEDQGLTLVEGLPLSLFEPDELEADGTAHWSEEDGVWVAEVRAVRSLG